MTALGDPLTSTSPGTLDSYARLIATVGFPTIAAGMLIYVIVADLVPATRHLELAMEAQTLTLQQQAGLLNEQTRLLGTMREDIKETREAAYKNRDILEGRATIIDEISQRLRQLMGDDPWIVTPPKKR